MKYHKTNLNKNRKKIVKQMNAKAKELGIEAQLPEDFTLEEWQIMNYFLSGNFVDVSGVRLYEKLTTNEHKLVLSLLYELSYSKTQVMRIMGIDSEKLEKYIIEIREKLKIFL